MRNLGDINDLYNSQNVILLCEIIENRFELIQDRYGFNPRMCNSAKSLTSSIERDFSKVIIALPTTNEIVDVSEQTLTGGFTCVNTCLAFDTEILLPISTEKTEDDLSKDYNYKACYWLKLDSNKSHVNKRIISKTLKLDKTNQYGYAMTKPMPTGCIKKEPEPTWRTFNMSLETVDLNNPIGHLFVVDISFHYEKAMPRQCVYNQIYPSIIEKQKIIDVAERSVYQLMEQYTENGDRKPKSYCSTKKAHATLFQKRFQMLYLEHLSFLINRAGWKVTKLYSHYSFEQERFKRNFILMNQKSRQNAKDSIEKDFFKLMNSANFEYDCRNNLDSCQLFQFLTK